MRTIDYLATHTQWVLKKHLSEHDGLTTGKTEAEERLREATYEERIVGYLKTA